MSVYRSGKAGKNSGWRGEFRHPVTGDRIYAPHLFATKAAGMEWERDERAKIQGTGGEYRGPNKVTVGAFIDQVWQPQRNVARSTADRDRALMPRLAYWRDKKLSEIRRSTVNAWIKELEAAESPHVAGKSVELLSTILDLAVADGLRANNPVRGVKVKPPPPHEDRILTDDEVSLIAQQMASENDRLLVLMLAYTGLRNGEAFALSERYLDLYEDLVHVRWTLDKRTGELKRLKGSDAAYRDAPLPKWLSDGLRAWLPLRPNPGTSWVFQAARGDHVRYDNWKNRAWKPAVALARIAKPLPTIHDLRHFYGTKLGAAGVGESNIAALMGHSATSRVTRRYVQPTASRLEQARQVMGET